MLLNKGHELSTPDYAIQVFVLMSISGNLTAYITKTRQDVAIYMQFN